MITGPGADEQVVAMGVFRTEQSRRAAKKRGDVRRSSDLHARGRAIAKHVFKLVLDYDPAIAMAEALSLPPGAKAASMCGRMWGIIDAVSAVRELSFLEATPTDLKKAVTGSGQATKDTVQKLLRARYPDSTAIDEYVASTPAGRLEHGFDALGAIVACLDSPIVTGFRAMAKRDPSMQVHVLGLDPGTENFGWAIVRLLR